MGTILINGELYHTDPNLDEDDTPLLDEYGEMIPKHVCICFAHGKYECVCGAWDVPVPED